MIISDHPSKPIRAALVVTTINDGEFLRTYVDNFKRTGTLDDVQIIVIPDKKTPKGLFEACYVLRREGANILCPSLEEQDAYLRKLGISELILYDSDHRRNIGFMMALENECDFLISIDDDNLCLPHEQFVEEHSVVNYGEVELVAIHSSNGWFNICELLDVNRESIYPRGFPYRFRHEVAHLESRLEHGPVHVNAGLWLEYPDLDAITWLASPARAISFRGKSVLLGDDTWAPINTQNTAVHRDAIVAFYFIRMGYPVMGMQIDRYGDIFSGYFCQACARHLGYRIRVGTPIVRHIRNKHNALSDLAKEIGAIYLIEDIAQWLTELKLQGSTYSEAYLSLAEQLEDAVEKIFDGFIWTAPVRAYFHQMAYLMRRWCKAVSTILGRGL